MVGAGGGGGRVLRGCREAPRLLTRPRLGVGNEGEGGRECGREEWVRECGREEWVRKCGREEWGRECGREEWVRVRGMRGVSEASEKG